MRFKLTLEYDGGPFMGWQRVSAGPSIQQTLEAAVESLTGVHADVTGAGRTDAGVHALGQVAHVDLDADIPASRIGEALNAHLRPHPIAVLSSEIAAPDFHARFDAIARVYCYRILPRRAPATLTRGQVWRVPGKLDLAAMQLGAERLVGRHDFTTFRDSHCQAKSPIKTLDRCEVIANGAEIEIWCGARSFLHRQVRSMAGTLIEAGLGKMSADEVSAALDAKDRARCGPVAPPEGLYLVSVSYPK